MGRDEVQLSAAKRAYRVAKEVGNREEEARWANLIGDILKNRGEYVEALKWLRIDYEISDKYLPEKQLLPTCQSLGEVYLRLEEFKDALIYQKKHLQLAEDASDIVEEQRACTQLGRTYYEMFLRSEDDHNAIRNAKKYFKSAMKLAKILKENPPASSKSSFLKEYIDAHNNIGMLEFDLDNLEAAHEILTKGLEICDEEEINEADDGRSRLHHNLGNVYMALRKWDKAKDHIEKDIMICHRIGHRQGEAKGYINLGELHYKVQRFEDARLCYGKALNLAKSMEDEDALVGQIEQNISTVKEAIKVMEELKEEEQKLKKLSREMADAKGTRDERKCLLQLNASLDRLIEKSSMIFAWVKHRQFAKRKKRIANEICDKEKLSDAFLVVGESYHKLRNFNKALKWYKRSWEGYKMIGNLEGQALAKINIGDVLDCVGDWRGALNSFEEGCRLASEADLHSLQLSALENMHYSYMIRFENDEEARKLKLKIDELKESSCCELAENATGDGCSETDTEGNEHLSNNWSNVLSSPERCTSNSRSSKPLAGFDEVNDDAPLISLIQPKKCLSKRKTEKMEKHTIHTDQTKAVPKDFSGLTGSQQTVVGRKRVRVILSDDESETENEEGFPKWSSSKIPSQNFGVSNETNNKSGPAHPQIDVEESACSYKSLDPKEVASNGNSYRSLSSDKAVTTADFGTSGSKCDVGDSEKRQYKHGVARANFHIFDNGGDRKITFRIGNDLLHLAAGSYSASDNLSMEPLKVELACLYYLQLPADKKLKGLLPIIQHMECGGRVLESLESYESLTDSSGNIVIEASIVGWVQKRLIKLYIECCQELSDAPNMKLLKKIYVSEIEDEVNVSECGLQDVSVAPLLNALHVHNTVAMLDLSHNVLGNGTMEKLKHLFESSSQRYGDLTLDLHCNRFGPTALFQICECPALFTRLEVLNISRNRLTDACGSYLSTILKNCEALYSLNIEHCSLTSRTIHKVADALSVESVLSQLSIGYNNPISGSAIQNLLAKLATLRSFSELCMNGIKLSSQIIDSLSELAKNSSVSQLMLGGSGIGTDGAIKVIESMSCGSQETLKLDFSCCGLASLFFLKLNTDITLVSSILELNVGGNSITEEGISALASLLRDPRCCLKVLVLNKSQLGLSGILRIIQSLSDNNNLEELNLADNGEMDSHFTLQYGPPVKGSSDVGQQNINAYEQPNTCLGKDQQVLCDINMECNNLEVADSEDEQGREEEAPTSAFGETCTTLNLSHERRFIEELSTSISTAKKLQFLDLSDNGFSVQVSETLYMSWSSGARANSARRHIKDKGVHFSVEAKECRGVKPCCKRV